VIQVVAVKVNPLQVNTRQPKFSRTRIHCGDQTMGVVSGKRRLE
jgi:hypothetical protein